MSRRKQGRPQQRKTLDPLEQDNDLLVCGGCQTNFPLQDILKFIKHKVNRCNKENVDLLDPADYEDGDQPESETVSISSKRTSISAPITRKEFLDNKVSPRPSLESIESLKDVKEDNRPSPEERLFDNRVPRSPLKSKQVTDAESNTICTEPSQFVCETCKTVFNSAWTLLQHAQKEHGMKIYTDYADSSATPPKQKKQSDPPRKGSPNERPSSLHHPQSPHHLQSHRSHHHHHHHHHHRERDRHESNSEQKDKDRDLSGIQQLPQELHRTPSSASSVGSAESGHCRQSPQHPFSAAFRFPFDRPPLSPSLPFPRIPGNDFHPITSEALHIGRGGLIGFPPHVFEPGRSYPPLPFERPRPPLGLESHLNQLDSFYSQRLKELARGPPSPARRQTPPFSQPGTNIPFPPITPPSAPPTTELNKENESGSLTPPSKLKSCEFCGKSFRFQSNLIVHRRSHTGEKPFKCPLCPHACTQQSKLKRHMKTHMKSPLCNIPNASEGSMASGGSTPDSSKIFGEKDDENEEEEEFEDEEEEMEEEEEFDESGEILEDGDANDTQLKKESMEVSSENKTSVLAAKLLEPPNSDQRESNEKKLQESSQFSKTSFLSEVMKNSGLTHLPVYNEAFKQALEENIKNENASPSIENKDISENGSSLSNSNSNDGTKEDGRNTATSRQSSDSDVDSVKKVKREPETQFNNTGAMENMYPSLWGFQHPQLDFFHSIPSVFHSRFDQDPNHNGFNATNHDSALKSLNPQGGLSLKPGPSCSADTNGLPTTPRRDRRNDTCEFCGKIFKNCSNLTVHRRSHTGEKPYKCELCSYACAQSSKLTRHMKTHGRIGKDVYRCKFCSMPFSVASTLEKHMRKCMENRQGRILQDADSDTNSTTASNA